MDFEPSNNVTGKLDNPNDYSIKKKVAIGISVAVSIIIIATIGVVMHINKVISPYENAIMPGVLVEGIDVTGMTKEEAVTAITDKYTVALSDRNINITAGNNTYTLPYNNIGVTYNIDETVNKAFEHNRTLNKFEKYKLIKEPVVADFDMTFTYDEEPIKNLVSQIEKDVHVDKRNATLTKNGSQFIVTNEIIGKNLNVQALLDDINSKVSTTEEGNVESTAEILDDVPSRTKAALSKVNTIIGSATTTFGTGDVSRVTNIRIGAQTLNGIVLMPGEQFSFNTTIGDTTPDKGYQQGGVYIGDKLEMGYGGGICQVSSTLHNAVLKSGIIPDQRTNHSMPVGYIPAGMDATIAYGYIDYVFSNPYSYPIYLEGYTYNGKVTFNIYSNSSVNQGTTYGFVSDVYETIPVTVRYVDTNELEKGQERIKQPGAQGYKSRVYRVTYVNGRETNRQLLYTDTYNALTRIIERGTK